MSEEKLERVEIRINAVTGFIHFRYRWEGCNVDGSDTHDEDVTDWLDDEIKQCVIDSLGEEARSVVEEAEIIWG